MGWLVCGSASRSPGLPARPPSRPLRPVNPNMGGRLAAAVGLAVLGFAVGRHTAGQEQERGWAAYDGRDWRGVPPPGQGAYLVGVLPAGALADARPAGGAGPAAAG